MKITTKQVSKPDGKLKAGEILYITTNLYHYQDGKAKEMLKAGYYLVVIDGLINLKNYSFIKAAAWITETDDGVKIYPESDYELVLKDYQCFLQSNQKEQAHGKTHIITKNGINLEETK